MTVMMSRLTQLEKQVHLQTRQIIDKVIVSVYTLQCLHSTCVIIKHTLDDLISQLQPLTHLSPTGFLAEIHIFNMDVYKIKYC